MEQKNGYDKLVRRKEESNLSNILFGRVPPQARDLEEVVLGAMMLEKEALYKTFGILKAEMFYVDAHQKIFTACSDLFQRSNPIDLLTVTDELRRKGQLEEVGGAYFVTELTSRIASAANIDYHAHIIYQKYIAREMIRICSLTIKDSFEDTIDVFDALKDVTKSMLNLQNVGSQKNTEPAYRINKAITQIEMAMNGKVLMGVPSGLRAIDELTGGWQKQDLITIASRPGAGKSALAIAIMDGASMADIPVWMFSLEMSDTQIAMRQIAKETNIKYSRLRTGKISNEEFGEVVRNVDSLANSNIYIDSESRLNSSILIAKLSKAVMEKGIKLAIVDYLNLMESELKSTSKQEKISQIVADLKRAAKQLDIPIILLCQLNREVEKTSDKRPELHHLKESGAIEEYSDIVMLLYRPAYYNENPVNAAGESEANILYVDIAKHKQGATGDVRLHCEIDKNIIRDIEAPFVPLKSRGEVKDFVESEKDDNPF